MFQPVLYQLFLMLRDKHLVILEGLIPGTIGNVGEINPLAYLKGFIQRNRPKMS